MIMNKQRGDKFLSPIHTNRLYYIYPKLLFIFKKMCPKKRNDFGNPLVMLFSCYFFYRFANMHIIIIIYYYIILYIKYIKILLICLIYRRYYIKYLYLLLPVHSFFICIYICLFSLLI